MTTRREIAKNFLTNITLDGRCLSLGGSNESVLHYDELEWIDNNRSSPDNSSIQENVKNLVQLELAESSVRLRKPLKAHPKLTFLGHANLHNSQMFKTLCKEETPCRLVICTPEQAPCIVFSILPYNKQHKQQLIPSTSRARHRSSTRSLSDPGDVLSVLEPGSKRETTYSPYLHPSSSWQHFVFNQHGSMSTFFSESNQRIWDPVYFYDPVYLDDPALHFGKHKTVSRLTSYVVSIIDYTKPSDLKKSLNKQFRAKFPMIQLTLTKLRSIKADLQHICLSLSSLDPGILAQSYVYYEKLILQYRVNKPNRKMTAGACLLLAAKMNDVKGTELTKLIHHITSCFKLSQRDLVLHEFPVIICLDFNLLLPAWEVLPHYKRIILTVT